MSGFYGVLGESDSSSDDQSIEQEQSATFNGKSIGTNSPDKSSLPLQPQSEQPNSVVPVEIPSFEDLSSLRVDEVTVLQEVYGNDFSMAKPGDGGNVTLQIFVRPLEIEPARVGSNVLLWIQLSRKYPYVVPKIDMRDVKGLSKSEQRDLMELLQRRSKQLASNGNVMILELVQVVEKFLHEHNRDPTLSEWEQMKAREKLQKEKELRAQEELSQLMKSMSHPQTSPSGSITERSMPYAEESESLKGTINPEDLERELMRQRCALEETRRLRQQDTLGVRRFPSAVATAEEAVTTPKLEEKEDDDEDFEDDYETAFGRVGASASRYKTDFIELGVLGRGGGGEVVKVRNRLDRRIYAIKKIILESEHGRHAKIGALQNRKLRREVTTISRMTHKNIVRYYQAWVEGDGEQGNNNGILEDEIPKSGTIDNKAQEMIHDEQEEDDDDSGSDQQWWANSPQICGRSISECSGWSHSSNEENSFREIDAIRENTNQMLVGSDETTEDMLGFGSPLLNGLGLQGKAYKSIVKRSRQKSNESEEDDLWDESLSVHVGDGFKGRNVLYIQMQYCETTLRKLIDEDKVSRMKENEIWRLVRQILEALAYIHEQNIVSSKRTRVQTSQTHGLTS